MTFPLCSPMSAMEKMKAPLSVLDCPGNREVVVKERAIQATKTFTFDKVFGPVSQQVSQSDGYRLGSMVSHVLKQGKLE